MGSSFGQWVRAVVLVGVIALAAASMLSTAGSAPGAATLAFAVPVADDNNDDPTGDDNNAERELRGQVLELYEDRKPPQALVATTGEEVWANLYNDQLERSGVRQGDHVRMQGEYNKGVFDAYEIDVQDRCCPSPNGNSGDGNDNG